MLYHPETDKLLRQLEADLPHAIILTGIDGVGLGSTARAIAGKQLASWSQPMNKKGEIDRNGAVYIESIRALYDQLRSGSSTRQIVVIDDANKMTIPAQHALLKLLEEPTKGTHFILTSHAPETLLATIRSRLQTITLLPISLKQSKQLVQDLEQSSERQNQLLFIAAGKPAEIIRLTRDSAYFDSQAALARQARQFLLGIPYQQLLIAKECDKNKSGAIALIDMACRIAEYSLLEKPEPALIRRLTKLLEARDRIMVNGNPRLQLMASMVQ